MGWQVMRDLTENRTRGPVFTYEDKLGNSLPMVPPFLPTAVWKLAWPFDCRTASELTVNEVSSLGDS